MKKIFWKIKYVWTPLTIAWLIDKLFLSWFALIGKRMEKWIEEHPSFTNKNL